MESLIGRYWPYKVKDFIKAENHTTIDYFVNYRIGGDIEIIELVVYKYLVVCRYDQDGCYHDLYLLSKQHELRVIHRVKDKWLDEFLKVV